MPVVVEDFAGESRFKKPEILRMHEVNSGVSVTIGSIGKIFGVLGVHSRKKGSLLQMIPIFSVR